MKHRHGFTLIELLVVIAIISILLAVVAPQVMDFLRRGKATAAAAEIHSIELALTKMLSDTNKDNLRQLFTREAIRGANAMRMSEQVYFYTYCFYQLLRQGRNCDLGPDVLRAEVRDSLGDTYLDLGMDKWNARYQFWAGPWNTAVKNGQYHLLGAVGTKIPFRCYQPGTERPDGGYDVWIYDQARKNEKDAEIPGNPKPDFAYGYPAPPTKIVYIWSMGEDGITNQNFTDDYNPNGFDYDLNAATMDIEYFGGGDDINNWDNAQGWDVWYN